MERRCRDRRPCNFKPHYASTKDFIRIVNRVTGHDYRWFLDIYVYSAGLPQLIATRDRQGLSMAWKAPGEKPFPMLIQVRVDGRDIDVPMRDGHGHVDLPAHALYTIEPHARVLRARPYLEAWKDGGQALFVGAASAASS